MKITALSFENVRALPDVELPLGEASKNPFPVLLVTGPMGSGKTRLLEAIAAWKEAIGPYGMGPRQEDWARSPDVPGAIQGTWQLSDDEVKRGQLSSNSVSVRVEVGAGAAAPAAPLGLKRLLSAFFREETHGKMEYFPASRHLSTAPLPVPLDALDEKTEGPLRTSKDGAKYGIERAWLTARLSADLATAGATLAGRGVLLSGQAPDSLSAVRSALSLLAPHLRLLGLGARGTKSVPRFARRPAGSRALSEQTEVDLDDLSDGERQALLFALAFGRLRLSRSVVLIDSPELFLHPADHARFFEVLCRLGRDNQVIAATCSKSILDSAPPESVLDLGTSVRRT